ncbi:hypothetical protein ACIPPR_26400 [Streptomyces nigra]
MAVQTSRSTLSLRHHGTPAADMVRTRRTAPHAISGFVPAGVGEFSRSRT